MYMEEVRLMRLLRVKFIFWMLVFVSPFLFSSSI